MIASAIPFLAVGYVVFVLLFCKVKTVCSTRGLDESGAE